MLKNQYNKFFIHCMGNVGDVLVATSAIGILRNKYPSAHITLMVKPSVADIARKNPLINQVITFDHRQRDKSIIAWAKLVKFLRSEQFDVSISLDRRLRTAFLTWSAGIPIRVGPDFDRHNASLKENWFYTDLVKMPRSLARQHQVEWYKAIVRLWIGEELDEKPTLPILDSADWSRVNQLLQEMPQDKLRVGLCIRGTCDRKNWPPKYIAEVVSQLSRRYKVAFYVTGGPGDGDYIQDFLELLPDIEMVNHCGQTSLLELVGLIQKTDVFISVDTGTMHIAAAAGIPLVSIFGFTPPWEWAPLSDQADIFEPGITCPTCEFGGSSDCDEHCRHIITVKEVLASACKKIEQVVDQHKTIYK